MYKLAVFALLVASASAGIVSPVDRCPAQGLPIQLRITDCEGAPPCNIVPNSPVVVEGDFIPSQNSDNAKFKLVAETSGGTIPVVDGDIGALTGGIPYTAAQTIIISSALSGQSVTTELSVYDEATERKEICLRAAMNIL